MTVVFSPNVHQLADLSFFCQFCFLLISLPSFPWRLFSQFILFVPSFPALALLSCLAIAPPTRRRGAGKQGDGECDCCLRGIPTRLCPVFLSYFPKTSVKPSCTVLFSPTSDFSLYPLGLHLLSFPSWTLGNTLSSSHSFSKDKE